MEFVLMGFDQSGTIRRFQFEGIGANRSRIAVAVLADLTLARSYDISLQSLPLLCLHLLEGSNPELIAGGTVTFSAADMATISKAARELAESKKSRAPRPVSSPRVGQAWRGGPMGFVQANVQR